MLNINKIINDAKEYSGNDALDYSQQPLYSNSGVSERNYNDNKKTPAKIEVYRETPAFIYANKLNFWDLDEESINRMLERLTSNNTTSPHVKYLKLNSRFIFKKVNLAPPFLINEAKNNFYEDSNIFKFLRKYGNSLIYLEIDYFMLLALSELKYIFSNLEHLKIISSNMSVKKNISLFSAKNLSILEIENKNSNSNISLEIDQDYFLELSEIYSDNKIIFTGDDHIFLKEFDTFSDDKYRVRFECANKNSKFPNIRKIKSMELDFFPNVLEVTLDECDIKFRKKAFSKIKKLNVIKSTSPGLFSKIAECFPNIEDLYIVYNFSHIFDGPRKEIPSVKKLTFIYNEDDTDFYRGIRGVVNVIHKDFLAHGIPEIFRNINELIVDNASLKYIDKIPASVNKISVLGKNIIIPVFERKENTFFVDLGITSDGIYNFLKSFKNSIETFIIPEFFLMNNWERYNFLSSDTKIIINPFYDRNNAYKHPLFFRNDFISHLFLRPNNIFFFDGEKEIQINEYKERIIKECDGFMSINKFVEKIHAIIYQTQLDRELAKNITESEQQNNKIPVKVENQQRTNIDCATFKAKDTEIVFKDCDLTGVFNDAFYKKIDKVIFDECKFDDLFEIVKKISIANKKFVFYMDDQSNSTYTELLFFNSKSSKKLKITVSERTVIKNY